MMSKIKNYIKVNKGIRSAYRRIGSFLLSSCGAIIPIRKKRALFVSFGGRQYSDSPRALYEAMCQDPYFDEWEFAWAFTKTEEIGDIGCKCIRIDTPKYFLYALSSRVWITNTSICRGLQFKKRGAICVNTWHGTPLKKMGYSLDQDSRFKEKVDIGCCQSEFDRNILMRLFNTREENILQVDLPRNDALLHYSSDDIRQIKQRLSIPEDKTVILYMPTYRDYNIDSDYQNYFLPPIDINHWEQELGSGHVLLVRFHYLIDRAMSIPESDFCINVTNYSNLNDLYAVTDVLVSDYSSSYIDYSILEKPMLCFAYDFDEYASWRGFEIDFENDMPFRIDKSENEILESIECLNIAEATHRASEFHSRFSPNAGHATEAVIAELKRRLS